LTNLALPTYLVMNMKKKILFFLGVIVLLFQIPSSGQVDLGSLSSIDEVSEVIRDLNDAPQFERIPPGVEFCGYLLPIHSSKPQYIF